MLKKLDNSVRAHLNTPFGLASVATLMGLPTMLADAVDQEPFRFAMFCVTLVLVGICFFYVIREAFLTAKSGEYLFLGKKPSVSDSSEEEGAGKPD